MTQSTSSTKRRLLASGLQACLGAALLAASPLAAWADTGAYPNQTIKVVIPFPPGGTLDTVGRTLAQRLSDQMGKPVIVENKPGGKPRSARPPWRAARPMATPCFSMLRPSSAVR